MLHVRAPWQPKFTIAVDEKHATSRAEHRRSGDLSLFRAFVGSSNVCDPIEERNEDAEDLEPADYRKRAHKHRRFQRSLSFPPPQSSLISTRTTQPVHILPATSTRSQPASPPMSSLKPDSVSARVRGTSHIDFKTATTGVQGKAMRNELARIVSTISDANERKVCHFFLLPLVARSLTITAL
jgi:hypothetical protein